MATSELPWEISFPPFYTLQLHEETRKRQIALWADILLKYHKSVKKNRFVVGGSCPIFDNVSIGRKVSPDLIIQVIKYLQEAGYIYPADKGSSEWILCWQTIDEYADIIYTWALETGQLNTVCTLYELSSAKPELLDIDEDILLRSLRKLEASNKCEVMNIDGSYGVKFF